VGITQTCEITITKSVDASILLRIGFISSARKLKLNVLFKFINQSRYWLKQYTSFGPWRWQMMFLLLGAGCPAMQAL
jgi:hypothetical protein